MPVFGAKSSSDLRFPGKRRFPGQKKIDPLFHTIYTVEKRKMNL
jgi:hypothetical protein